MKIAVLADIHANAIALQAVLQEIDDLAIDKILVCGDLLGYYYQAKEVLRLLEQREVYLCRGNHEELFQRWCEGSPAQRAQLQSKYGSGFARAEAELSSAEKNYLASLPHPLRITLDKRAFCLAHGTPWDINYYVYFDKMATIAEKFATLPEPLEVVLLGHTHYQGMAKTGKIIVLNPGSVGQPRSGVVRNATQPQQVRAQWAMIETQDLSITLKTSYYDASTLFASIAKYDDGHPYLSRVLYRCEA